MNKNIKDAIEKYQCPGCTNGHNISCFQPSSTIGGVGCGAHSAGTFMSGIGKIFLGLPIGFNRLGHHNELQPVIFERFENSGWEYNIFNIPVWKHLTSEGHTLVRGIMPRRNEPFLHIYLENCIDKINCEEITEAQIKDMD